jgi:Ser/Thr protein kinase RdoA (MazF antagonist)
MSALKRFPVRAEKVTFIHHGENTTFEVGARGGAKYLLRVHRHGYHTKDAIGEEMLWLERLGRQNEIATPRPLRSKSGRLIETVDSPGVEAPRECSLLHWVDGRFVFKSASPKHFALIGRTIAHLHESTRGIDVHHRRYWTAEGLAGRVSKFGSVEELGGASKRELRILSEARKRAYRELSAYERSFPRRMGLVHADLHFGNFLFREGGGDRENVGVDSELALGVIDFDDCGYGFHAYDFAVPLVALPMALGEARLNEIPRFRDAMLNAYATYARFDAKDDRAVTNLIVARRLSLLCWLNSRIDHAILRSKLKGSIERAVAHIERTKYLD